jgi:hypothetical protein
MTICLVIWTMEKEYLEKVKKGIIFFIISFCLSTGLSYPDTLEDEIEHLLNYIKNSECVFIRNGKEHSPEEAEEHILRKYEYFKDDIQTTEDFIELCATKSTVSKEFYYIKCGNYELVKTKDWLMDELMIFRAK